MIPIKIKSEVFDRLSEEEFFNFCRENRNLRIERTSEGEIIIMTPTYSKTGAANSEINFQLQSWNKKTKLGKVFDSSAGFYLPNGAMRSPDAAWISNARWNKLSVKEQDKFAHICPDFVIELRSSSDALDTLKEKMEEWIKNGCLLGWLIDLKAKSIFIFRSNGTKETKKFGSQVTGEDVLPGFELDFKELE